ncbi:hypothetical protein H2248_000412 [Termitomyces sp. 'cryptogamus']|nr:hypothetical protein H2248_000412 [Termitomyces sp. 'cryptogamus']
MYPFLNCFLVLAAALATEGAVIVPGAAWTDTGGNVIQAHGGGFLKVSSTYYWYGEDKSLNSALFHAVSCYTSADLMTWTRQNDALTPIDGTNISTSNIVERPKVVYNQVNSEYVMWFHSDSSNYGAAQVGVATAKTPCGPYNYRGSFKPLGADSRDMSLFQDDDGMRDFSTLLTGWGSRTVVVVKLRGLRTYSMLPIITRTSRSLSLMQITMESCLRPVYSPLRHWKLQESSKETVSITCSHLIPLAGTQTQTRSLQPRL